MGTPATLANLERLAELVKAERGYRSAWDRGVKAYALDILANFEDWSRFNAAEGLALPTINERTALNGAEDWKQYAYGGSGLVYNIDIAERLCTPSQVRKLIDTDVQWLDLEATALLQAWRLIARLVPLVAE